MNDEIKEILDYFQKDVDKYEDSKKYLMQKYGYNEETIDNISQHERHINTKKLLDYITNLQQENQRLEENNQNMQEEMAKVWGKNESLKEEQEYNNYCDEQLRKKISNLEYKITTLEDYKSRCEKASEYIKKSIDNSQPFYEYLFGDENGKVENLDKLLKILQNGSDSQ